MYTTMCRTYTGQLEIKSTLMDKVQPHSKNNLMHEYTKIQVQMKPKHCPAQLEPILQTSALMSSVIHLTGTAGLSNKNALRFVSVEAKQ
jgi:hypothetical protein